MDAEVPGGNGLGEFISVSSGLMCVCMRDAGTVNSCAIKCQQSHVCRPRHRRNLSLLLQQVDKTGGGWGGAFSRIEER